MPARSWGPPLRRVVAATDLSAPARTTLRRVRRLPLAQRASVTVLLVAPRSAALLGPDGIAAAGRLLDREAAGLGRHLRSVGREDVTIRTAIARGNAGDEIAVRARIESADLVVVGRRGAGAGALALGSTAEHVLRASGVPVLVVGRSPDRPYRTALIALDAEPNGLSVLDAGLSLLSREVVSVDAFTTCWFPFQGSPMLSLSRAEAAKLRQDEARRTRSVVERVLAARRRGGLELVLDARVGDPRWEVPKAIRRHRPDLVVVGSHGRSGIAYLLLGSTFRDVVAATESDILVVPLAAPRRR